VSKVSAGILVFRYTDGIEFLLVHPGGPFFAKKDVGAWSIPKGEIDEGEDALGAAKREFFEELGIVPEGNFVALQPVKQKGGKTVIAWALEGDLPVSPERCNKVRMEWPPRSGRFIEFPEIDKAGWFSKSEALSKINLAQAALVNQLLTLVGL
jgi:predicted NUDIX family NTP pyrophosphohydrolase